MTPERWQEVKDVLQRALDVAPEQRSAFLEQTCSSDRELRHEVESLLAAHDQERSSFLQSPPAAFRLHRGMRLGDYEVQSLLGAGGMGEVYRAHDPHLGRDVAIKVLAGLSTDPDRLRRFEQEAKAAAALNHPNIVVVFQLGIYKGVTYVVSELLEGETLRDRMRQSGLPIRKVIDYGAQIARGLSAAHNKGIIHRDLKPENLFIPKDGRVKILDFGLAKLTQLPLTLEAGSAALTQKTEPGMVMGTVGYMSPEQVRGQSCDHRTDIFSFGAVLYEMQVGSRAFQKPTYAETMSAILNEDPPDMSRLLPPIPSALQLITRRCLEKNPEHRFQSASDLAFALEALSDSSSVSALLNPQAKRSWQWIAAAVTGIAILSLAGWWLTRPALEPPRVVSVLQITRDNVAKGMDLATDGPRLYFSENIANHSVLAQVSASGGDVAEISTPLQNIVVNDAAPGRSEVLVQSFGTAEAMMITGITQGTFWAIPVPAGSLRRLGNLGGPPHGAAWSRDGQQLVYFTGHDLYTANSDGTASRKLVTVDGVLGYPRFSPDGIRVRFSRWSPTGDSVTLWEAKTDGSQLHRVLTSLGDENPVCCGDWSADGRYYFFSVYRDGRADIWAVRDTRSGFGETTDAPVKITTGPLSFDYAAPVPARDGNRIFIEGEQSRGHLLRYDASRRSYTDYLGGISAAELDFSRDGKWVTYIEYPEMTLWRSRLDGTQRLQLTVPPMVATMPRWSPDGQTIAFGGVMPGKTFRAYLISAQGGDPEPLLPQDTKNEDDANWSEDGTSMILAHVVWAAGNSSDFEIATVDLKTRRVTALPESVGLYAPRFSPDGHFISAFSADGHRIMLFDLRAKKWSELLHGNVLQYPDWSRDAKYIYFEDTNEGIPSLYRVNTLNRKVDEIVSLKNVPRPSMPYGVEWHGITPDGSPLVMRDVGIREIYSLELQLP